MKRSNVGKEIWLNYFNQVLFEKGLITKEEFYSMRSQIWKRTHEETKE